jgi:putative endopeptidase
MNKTLITIAAIAVLAGCAVEETTPGHTGPALGFDPEDFDASVRPQDDFYSYVNGRWLSATEIPAEWSSYGVMQILYEETEQQLLELIEEAINQESKPEGSEIQKIGELYASFIDEPLAERLGIEPLEMEFNRIAKIRTHADVIRYMGHALTIGIQGPINFYIDANAANPTQNLAYIWQDGLGMPDRDYYLSDAENLAEVRRQYTAHIENMFALAGWPDGASAAQQISALEERIAQEHWSRVQNRDRQRIYTNKFDIESADALSPNFDWAVFLEISGFGSPDEFVIAQTDYFSNLGAIIQGTPVAEWQTYYRFKALKSFAPYLNTQILQEDFDFERRVLRGQEEIRPRWKRGVRIVNGGLGEALGRTYVERHFPPDSKQRLDTLIENLRVAFRQSIEELDWMSAETKSAALMKLEKFTSKIGFPANWRDYTGLEIKADDLVGNVQRFRKFEHDRQVSKLAKPVDRSEWGMTPQTINAYYRPTMNEIVFPAAILQPPFFDPQADDATNYGSIGAIIGHEFSHGFDDQGRKFDGDGRLMDWWTESDALEYETRSAGLVAQYSEFEPLPDQNINGELTVGENIADLAGLIMAYRAWQILQSGSDTPAMNGFSGEQRFFIGYAQSWRAKQRPEYLTEMLLSDPHSPSRYRVIGALRNMPEFYAAFNVAEGDGMYLPDNERVRIW